MKRISYILVVALLAFSCGESKKESKITKEPIMYESSEMALLMRSMYEFNKANKVRILKKDSLLWFPENFIKIHTAILTDPNDRDKEFDSLSTEFLSAQKATLLSDKDSVKYHFNTSINLCIACHETRCTGPIPKIKKLLIQ